MRLDCKKGVANYDTLFSVLRSAYAKFRVCKLSAKLIAEYRIIRKKYTSDRPVAGIPASATDVSKPRYGDSRFGNISCFCQWL